MSKYFSNTSQLFKSSYLMVAVTVTFFSFGLPTARAGGKTVNPGQNLQLRWRYVGPYRAGWATMAVGVPSSPNTFYFGAAGGGVWKTTNAGLTWQGLMQHEKSSSVGAIAVSSSNPDIVYVGTGQVDYRYDILSGDGVYRSDDGGKTWKNIGLSETHHIGMILIDPKNSERILVAALGHIFKSNPERGVYLSENGGKTWTKVLYVNDSTGAVDLSWDPSNPSIVYAAMWQVRMHPWLDYFYPQLANGSAIYKSQDSGRNWRKLSGNGLPDSPLGRIGIAVAPGSNGSVVYATIIATNGKSGLYKSVDGGNSWTFVNNDPSLANNYFSRLTVDPNNPNVVYVMGRSIRKSVDGGKTFHFFKGAPGGDDYHYLWINPDNSSYMITASDQGCVVSVDSGQTWSSWYNQPTGQFYSVAVDNQFPYKIYSGQQDNGTVGILSRGPYGVIEDRDWHPVGGDERDYDVPKPDNPDLIFGSGLGGHVSRFDDITRQVTEVSPWPVSSYGSFPPAQKYRYTWITPIVFSKLPPYPLYFGAQVLFKSLDNGNHWHIISPDLTGKIPGATATKDPDLTTARDAGFGAIFSIAPSPISNDVIWVGSDNGILSLTTDGGKHWKNVTPTDIPIWARIDAIAPSHFSKRNAYVAVNTHRIGFQQPLIFKTTDSGRTWRKIVNGIPVDEYTNSVVEDPIQRGLIFSATSRTIYFSYDDGNTWHKLNNDLPTTCINALAINNSDLIAATQGRGIWVLDNIEPLREFASGVLRKKAHLFKPIDAIRIHPNENKDTPWPPETPLGKNPPAGAVIDYWLSDTPHSTVKLTINDSKGRTIAAFTSSEQPQKLNTEPRYFESGWIGKQEKISTAPGMHRFVWNLRYPRPPALSYNYSIAAVWHDGTPLEPEGAFVLPGRYNITLTVDSDSYTESLNVRPDPRIKVSMPSLKKQLDLELKIYSALKEGIEAYNEINQMISSTKYSKTKGATDSLSQILNRGTPNISSICNVLSSLEASIEGADSQPTAGQLSVYAEYKSKLDYLLRKWRIVKKKLVKSMSE